MTKIIDVIKHKNMYNTQTFLVLDKMPEFIYERVGSHLIAEDCGFYNFYAYRRSTEAFDGRKFDIPLVGGSVEKATGQWWHTFPEDYYGLVDSIGIGSPQGLAECNVFSSANVDLQVLDDWMANNEPSNNYYKYDKRNKNYGLHKINSKFDVDP